MGKTLFSRSHEDKANKFGVNVHASAGAESQHTLHIILDSGDSQKVDEFLAPFAQMGSVEITPDITCEAIVGVGRG